jgi:hypothetical protein
VHNESVAVAKDVEHDALAHDIGCPVLRLLRVAIMQEITTVSKGAASFHCDVPSHLLHPLLGSDAR